LLAAGRTLLSGQPEGRLEAEILLGEVLGVDRAWLFAHPEHPCDEAQVCRFMELARRRKTGEPVAYLTGRREFWSLPLKVTDDVLIPRPETELLVETVLNLVPPEACWRIVDLGTGSGAIALAIAHERPHCEIHATDYSEAALRVAKTNAAALAPGRIEFHHGSWFEPLTGTFQVIVSNPPYVAENDPHLDRGDCRFEPSRALTAGPEGLEAIRTIASESRRYLSAGGWLAFEHGFDQGKKVRDLLGKLGFQEIRTTTDLEGRERVTVGKWG